MDKKQLTVLFVDDEDTIRESMESSLSAVFEKVYVAANGKEAKEIFDNNRVDVLISDINMPSMNGVELIECIREETDLLPIVVATGHSEMKVLYSDIYNIYVVVKPYDVRTIVEIIEKAEKEIDTRNKCLESIHKLQAVKNEAMQLLDKIRGVR